MPASVARYPLALTKLNPPPRVADTLVRGALLAALRATEQLTLNLLVAPAGFGKSTMLAQWHAALSDAGHGTAWLSLDQADSWESQFAAGLAAALSQAGLDSMHDAWVAFEQSASATRGIRFIDDLVNALQDVERSFFLVLDDVHLIADSAAEALLERLVLHAPANLHLLAACRAAPRLPLSRLKVAHRATLHETALLRFSLEETRDFLRSRVRGEVPAGAVRDLHDVTEGWAGGLQLAAIALNQSHDALRTVAAFERGHRDIGAYLGSEVLAGLDDELRDFLLRTAPLSRFNAALCEYVVGVHGCGRLLARLERDNLFLIRLDEQGEWFRYHHMFQAHLRGGPLASADSAEVHRRASRWFAARQMLADAVEHALACGDTEFALEQLEGCAMQLVADGNLATLGDWLARLPAAAVAGSWHLNLAHCWTLVLTSRLGAAREAITALRARAAGDEERLFVCAVLDAGMGAYGDDSACCLRLTEHFPPHGDAYHVSAACNIVSCGYLLEGRIEAARNAQTWARQWDSAHCSAFGVAYGQALVAYSYLLQGAVATAREQLESIFQHAVASTGTRSAPACVAAAFLAAACYEAGELEAVCELIGPRCDVLGELVVPEGAVRALTAYARASAVSGHPWDAEDALQRLRAQGESSGCARLSLVAVAEQIRLRLTQAAASDEDLRALDAQQDELEAACARACAAAGDSGSAAVATYAVRLSRARVQIARGASAAAVPTLNTLADALQARGWLLPALEVRALLAVALAATQRTAQARHEFAQVVQSARAMGALRSVADAGPQLVSLISALEAAASAEQHAWLAHLRHSLPAASHDTSASATGFSTRELEIASLLGEGLPNKIIASTLGLAPDTIKWHLKNLYRKLGVSSRYHATRQIRARGLFAPER